MVVMRSKADEKNQTLLEDIPEDLPLIRADTDKMKQVILNAGATKVFVNPCDVALGGAPGSRHIMGTLRMGSDAATSVVDPNGRFHDVDNLYACDGSVFPTSSGNNPTLTIMAVALRMAHGLAGTSPQP